MENGDAKENVSNLVKNRFFYEIQAKIKQLNENPNGNQDASKRNTQQISGRILRNYRALAKGVPQGPTQTR